MLHASTKKLIDRLAEMTDLAKLDWTEGDDGNITYSTEGYSVSLTEAPNEMVITSKDGKELERAGAEELANTQAENGGTYADIVAAMTKEAARVARGTETAISTLLAGMEDAPAEPDVAEAAPQLEEEAEAELQEDPGDETAVLTDDSVEAVSAETEPVTEASEQDSSETEDEPEAAAFAETSEDTEAEAEPEVETFSASSDESDVETDETIDESVSEEDSTEPASEVEIEAAPESEDDVTEAVVRLADEVNQREDNGLNAAAASAVGAVALAAGLTTGAEESESENTEPESVEAEPVQEETVSAFAATDEAPTEAPAYVPFGLEEVAESEVVVETEASETSVEPVSEPAPESASVYSLNGAETTEPEAEPVVEEVSVEPADAWAPQQAASEETVETAVETIIAPGTPDAVEDVPEVQTFAAAAPVAEETIEPAAPVEEAVEPVAEAPQPTEAQTYSLSGIGAGFGLGALSAKSEASGIPGPSSFGAAEEEKVVIDATEDVLPEIDGKPALPAGVAPIPAAATPEGDTAPDTAAEAAEGEADILKPRTRFNPWD